MSRARRGRFGVVAWVVLAVALAAGAGWWWTHRDDASASAGGASAGGRAASGPAGTRRDARGGPGAARVQPVATGRAEQRDVAIVVDALGTIAAANTVVVRAKVDGEVRSIDYREGQPVRAGQLLATIDPSTAQIALAQAEATAARDRATLANARLDLQRYRDLVAQDAAPRQQADTQAALVAQLEGTVRADDANVRNARLQLSYTRVLAPISGVAGLKQVDVGTIVRAGDTNGIVTIAQMQPAVVVFAVPEARVTRLRAQLRTGARLPVQAWDQAGRQMLASGVVASIDNAIDPATGTLRIKAQFPNADLALYPSQPVDVRLELDRLAGATAVPSAAVQRGAQGTFVYVVGADSTVSMRAVQVRATEGDHVAIEGDVRPGDVVVTDGADKLRDGAKVEPVAPAPSGAASGGGRRRGASAAAGPGMAASRPAAGAGSAAAIAAAGRPAFDDGMVAAGAAGRPSSTGPAATQGVSPLPGGAAAGATSGASGAAGRPGWMDRVPPEVAARLQTLSPEERRAWLQQRRAASAAAGGGAAP